MTNYLDNAYSILHTEYMAKRFGAAKQIHFNILIFSILLILLPLLLWVVYQQTAIKSKAATVNALGPGELSDITVIPSIAVITGNGTTTLTVYGPKVTPYTALTAKHYYYYQSGDAQFTPRLQETLIPLTKTADIFKGSAVLKSGCIDIFAVTTYLSSICISVESGTVSYPNMTASAPEPRLPYRYMNGKYEWNYSRPYAYLSGTRTSKDMYFVLSSTLPFDKNTFPYYQTGVNFVPTNYYWTDTVKDSAYDNTALGSIHIAMIPSPGIPCSYPKAMVGVFPSLMNGPVVKYSVTNSPYATGGCYFYTSPVLRPVQNFSTIRNTYLRLLPTEVTVTPTMTPAPTIPPIQTITPTKTPTSTPRPTPIVPEKLKCTTNADCGCGFDAVTKTCMLENKRFSRGQCNILICMKYTNCTPACISGKCSTYCTPPTNNRPPPVAPI
jgi:hypothetical protein